MDLENGWWHTIEFKDGSISKGQHDYRGAYGLRFLMPEDLKGKTVLDFGTWDGFWAIEALKRGADKVMAVDRWSPMLKTTAFALGQFRIAYGFSGDLDFPLRGWVKGGYDVVLFYGIVYHLRNPYQGLRNAFDMCREGGIVIIESAVSQGQCEDLPMSIPACWITAEGHDNDQGIYFMPNPEGLIALAKIAGFSIPIRSAYSHDRKRFTIVCKKEKAQKEGKK